MDAAWARLKADVAFAQRAVAPDDAEGAAATRAELLAAIEAVTARCREERAAQKASEQPEDLSDEALVAAARFVDHVPLAPFANVLHLTPRLVNVVTVRSNSVIRKHTAPASRPVRSTNRLTHACYNLGMLLVVLLGIQQCNIVPAVAPTHVFGVAVVVCRGWNLVINLELENIDVSWIARRKMHKNI